MKLSSPLKPASKVGEKHQEVDCLKDQDTRGDCNLVQTKIERSNIVDFYYDRSVLITGGSGFIGKVLIEKLMRTCSSIRRIFVLIRPKWNKQPTERLEELLKSPLFDGIRNSDLCKKIIVVEGDVTQSNLGLSEQNLLKIMNEVSVIFHSAATVKFDEPLKLSVTINIEGTKNMIELCRKIPQLAALVHVSTAYANCDYQEVEEYVYPVDMSPEKLIEMAKWLDQDTMQELKLRLLKNKPNTYTYTKSLAEWLLVQSARDLPVVICRPSIVVASWKEPFKGWIDNVNGPTGIILGTGKGLVRSFFADPDCVADLVPVDTVINMIITLGWFAHVYKNHKQINDGAESLAESLIGSSSGEESLDGYIDQPANKNYNHEELIENTMASSRKTINLESNGNEDYHKVLDDVDSFNNNNNNNNHGSSVNYNVSSYEQAKGKSSEKITLLDVDNHKYHLLNNNLQQALDDGYGSAIHSPATNNSTSSISSSMNRYRNYSNITSTSETSAINHNSQIEDESQRVLSLANQRRLAEQKHAAFEYKLKQFRHNTQIKLAAQNLPEEIADIPVFHCTSGTQNPITWCRIQVLICALLTIYPSISTYRMPNGKFTKSKLVDDYYRLVSHYIPGYIVDFITRLVGGKPMLVKVYKKIDQAANVLKAFTVKQWKFNHDNRFMLINELMSEEDRRLFECDIRSLDWEDFLTNYCLGVRKFLLKEPIENLQQARTNLNIVYYRNLSLQVLFTAIFAYFMLNFISNLF